jgi:hypothetical protein
LGSASSKVIPFRKLATINELLRLILGWIIVRAGKLDGAHFNTYANRPLPNTHNW